MRFFLFLITLSLFSSLSADPIKMPSVWIKAKSFEYDKMKDSFFAYDNIHLIYNKNHKISELFCDKMIYEKQTGKVYALGHVLLKDSEGNINHSESLEVTQDFTKGYVDSIHLITNREERFLADKCHLENNLTYFYNGNYTPCKVCGKESGTWQISAKEIIHDKEDHSIIYHHAIFSVLNVPLFYIPYFSHPDPSVKRKSGLIFPDITYETDKGFSLGPSYFFVIDEHSDLTLSPIFFQKDNPVVSSHYRKKFYNGMFELAGSFHRNKTYKTPTPSPTPTNTSNPAPLNRWNIYSKIGYDIDDNQRLNIKISRAGDTSYFMNYPGLLKNMPLDTDLISFAWYERFYNNYYLSVKTNVYQTDLPKTTPVVLPNIFFEKFSDKPFLGGNWTFLTQLDHLHRSWGVPGLYAKESTRSYTRFEWDREYLKNNHLITLRIEMNVVLQALKGYKETPILKANDATLYQQQINNNLFKTRYLPITSIEWAYPLLHRGKKYHYIIEPKTMLIGSPYSDNNGFPNDDSKTLTLDNTTLFLPDRFDGHDRFDSGIRFVYGLNQKMYFGTTSSIEWFIGQSRRLDNRQIFMNSSFGEDNKYSDIVNSVKVIPFDGLKLRFRNAIDYKSKTQRFLEIGVVIGKPILLFDAGYIKFKDTNLNATTINQLNSSISSKINDQWSISYAERRDFTKNHTGPLTQYASIVWQNDCLKVSTGIYKSNITNNDVKPFTGFLVELTFKNLGSYALTRTEAYTGSMLSHF